MIFIVVRNRFEYAEYESLKYLAAYEEQDKDIFYGREKEQDEFTALVKNNLYVTLYGRTGIGKTSFLKAGVFPSCVKATTFR